MGEGSAYPMYLDTGIYRNACGPSASGRTKDRSARSGIVAGAGVGVRLRFHRRRRRTSGRRSRIALLLGGAREGPGGGGLAVLLVGDALCFVCVSWGLSGVSFGCLSVCSIRGLGDKIVSLVFF